MLTIREEQLSLLAERSARDFEARMLAHVREFFPEEYEELGEGDLRALIQEGIVAASRYSIFSEQDVCRYIDLMLVLGDDFDVDPSLPWAAQTLHDAGADATAKLDRLYDEVSKLPAEDDAQ